MNVKFDLNYGYALSAAAIWSYIFTETLFPMGRPVLAILVLVFSGVAIKLYRKEASSFQFDRNDLALYGAFFSIYLLAHLPRLFFSLGGDELYHAERAAFLLIRFSFQALHLADLPLETYRESIWRLFDLRHNRRSRPMAIGFISDFNRVSDQFFFFSRRSAIAN